MKRLNSKRILLLVPAVVLVALSATLGYWVASTKGPSGAAQGALQGDAQVSVTTATRFITFEPVGRSPSTGLVFYPGAGVHYRSYAPPLRAIAAQGFIVAVPEMPLNLAFLRTNAADDIITQSPDIGHWVIGGHSLGGVAAAQYAANHAELAGLVLWASYPADDSLSQSTVEVLSVYGSQDGLTTPEDIASSRALLPPGAIFVEITGGNHAQFGSYGAQGGDRPATISAEAQWAQIVEATVSFLEGVSD
jgi:pimeloyl-ACP methyl ester carboxylesterase